MRKLLFQPLIGCLGTSLFIGYFSYAAVADRVEKLAPAIKAQHGVGTEEPPLDCNLEGNQEAESAVTELLEQARQYANSKNAEKAAEILIQAFQLAQPLKNPQTKVNLLEGVGNDVPTYYSRLLGNIVDHYAAAGKKDRAATVIRQVLQVTQTLGSGYSFVKTKTLAEIAGHYAAIGQAEQALKIISQSLETAKFIQGAEFKTKALTEIAKAYVAAGKPLPAAAILSQSLQEAKAVEYPNPYRKGEVLAEIAITYAKARQYNQAIQIAQTIVNADYYQASAWSAIASQYAESGQLAQSLQIAQTINMADIKAKTLAEIGSKYAQTRQQDKASDVFSQAVQTAQTVDTAYDRRSTTLAEVAIQYVEVGQLDLALQAVQTIDNASIKAKALAAIAFAYGKAGQQAQASLVLSQTLELIKAIQNANQRAEVLQEVIGNYIKASQYDQAFQIAQTMDENNFFNKIDTLLQIASLAADAGQYDLALQIVESMDKSWIDQKNQALQKIAIAYAKAEQYDKALQVAHTLENAGSTYTYRSRTVAAIANQYSKAGQAERASEVFAQAIQTAFALEDAGSRAEALAAVALEYAIGGQQNKAKEILSQALQLAQTIKEPSSKSYTLRTITEQYIAAERYDLAFLGVKEMTDKSEISSKVEEIVSKYVESGKYDTALQAIDTLQAPEDKARIMTAFANKFIEAGRYDTAFQFINDMQAPEDKARIMTAIASKYIQIGQKNKSSEILAQAFQIAQTIKGPESRVTVVTADYNNEGNVIRSTEVDDPYDRGSLLAEIALKYAQAGQYNQALQVAEAIKNAANRNQLSRSLACYQPS